MDEGEDDEDEDFMDEQVSNLGQGNQDARRGYREEEKKKSSA